MRTAGLLCLAALAGAPAVAAAPTAPAEPLPAKGVAPGGLRYDFSVARADPDSSVRWCSRLTTSRTLILDGKPHNRFCSGAPRRRLSGGFDLDCGRGPLFLYGAAGAQTGRIRYIPRRGASVLARRFAVPDGVGVRGTFFVIAVRARSLPATLVVGRRGGGRAQRIRFPKLEELCQGPEGRTRQEIGGIF